MLCGLKGSRLIEPWNLTSEMMLTTIMTNISKAKKKPAILVETEMPRTIMNDAKAKKISTQMIHGTDSRPDTL